MVLTLAVAVGLAAGLGWARWRNQTYRPPELRHLWLVFAAFLPQFVVLHLPFARQSSPDWLVAVLLIVSQVVLLIFVWLNRVVAGALLLLCGVFCNLAVMTANGGFMPISPQTASRLVSEDKLEDVDIGSRFGSKDILLPPRETRLQWLADRFLPPYWFPYQVAFSLGDVFIALGVFWLLANPGLNIQFAQRGISI